MSKLKSRLRVSRSFLIALVVLGGLCLLATFTFDDVRSGCDKRGQKLSDFKFLYIALKLHALDHEGRFPEDFRAAAREQGYNKEDILMSPSLQYFYPKDSPATSPETVVLRYETEDALYTVRFDGSGKAEAKGKATRK